jgi:uncharacterized protein (TIRG00374 family)
VSGPDGDRPTRARPATPLPRPVKRVLKLLIVLAIVNYLVIPQLVRTDFRVLLRVNLYLVLLGTVLQVGKLAAYTIMTRAVVPLGRAPRFWTLFRIQLSSYAISHVLPGGTAAGGVLAYRLLTAAGMRGTDAAFAMATQGIGSAVVLNVILCAALLVSIPVRGLGGLGFLYAIAALLALLLIGGFSAAVVLLVRGEEGAVRVVRALAARVPLLDPDAVERGTRGVATRLQVLAADRRLLVRAVGWGAASWLCDAASLWVFLGAFGDWVPIDGLLIAFGLANVLAAVPITPQGLGLVEGLLIPVLTGFGSSRSVAVLGVLAYRLVNFWLPIPVGFLAYLSLEVQRGIRERRADELRHLAEESIASAEDSRTWAERHGMRLRRDGPGRPRREGRGRLERGERGPGLGSGS